MKVKFTLEELNAVELAYWNNEGYLPNKTDHIPKEREYQALQKLCLRMEKRFKKEKGEKYEN